MTSPESARPLSLAGIGSYVPALDGVRAVAVLLVIIMHYTMYLSYVAPVHPWLIAVTGVGWSGVDLFFVLSGYLITGILLDSKENLRYFRTFYARRVLRIFPLYYGFLTLAFLVVPAIVDINSERFEQLLSQQWWYWAYLSNILNALRGGWGPDGFVTTHFWSLAVEEQFYLVWPMVVYLLSRRALLRLCLGIILTLPFLRLGLRLADVNAIAVYVLTITRMDALAMGALISLLVRSQDGLRLIRKWYPALGLAALGSLIALFAWRRTPGQFDIVTGTLGHSIMAVLFGTFLVFALATRSTSRVGRFLNHPVAGLMGRYSYGIYVYHLPLVGILALFFPLAYVSELLGSRMLGGAVFVLTALIGTLVVAATSWHVFEAQVLKLKRWFPYDTARNG